MKLLILTLTILLLLLLYGVLVGEGSVAEIIRIEDEINLQNIENLKMKQINDALVAELVDLKQGLDAVEERARSELGMIKQGETFYQVIDTR